MKNKILIGALAFAFVFTIFGVSYAATEWSDDNTFTGIVNAFPNGITIGEQDTGGVTFFNGTIVNETTTDDVDNPVAFGDNVRIDGEIWRGEDSGPGDDYPVKMNDDLLLYGDLTVQGENPASGVDYDNTDSGLTGENVQDAIDEISYNYITSYGVGTVQAGQDDVVISDTNVTATSYVVLSVGRPGQTALSNQNGGVRVESITAGTGFTVATMDGANANANNIPFSYIVLF